jgi:hypothetical protein
MTVNYSFGFIRRGFMGSFVELVSQTLRGDSLTIIYITQFVGMIIFIALLFGFFFLNINKTDSVAPKMMILFFIAMGSLGYYFFNWGEMDVYMISITLVACILIIKDKCIWLVPLLSAICVMIHEGYVMMYLGIIIALLLYRAAVATGKDKRKYWICLLSTGLIASALFIYFYFFSTSVSRVHIDEIIANTERIFKFSLPEDGWSQINMRYIFAGTNLPFEPMWGGRVPTEYFYWLMFIVLMNLLICLPIVLTLIDFWKMVIRQNTDKRKKIFIALCISLQFLTLPLVLVQTDQARWFYDFVYFNFILISSVICIGDIEFSLAAEKCFTPTISKVILFIFYFIFYMNPHTQQISKYYMEPSMKLTSFLIEIFRPEIFQ